jgi:restriction endonuclease S subunit
MGEVAFRVIQYSELERWDVKYFAARIKSQYPIVSLADFVTEHNEKIRPFESPDETFKILGVNNVDGIFHAYDAPGKEIKQPYKKVSAGDFAYNPYRINVGSIGWIPPEHDSAYISPAYVVFSVDSSVILPEVFWFILKSDFFNQTLRAATAGSVRMNLTYPLLETLKIPIPPLPIQQKIVAHWEAAQQERAAADTALSALVLELHSWLVKQTKGFGQVTRSKVFLANYENTQQWDVKAGRAATFITANPDFIRLGDCTEECTETIRPWDEPEKEWPMYGVNNKDGVFLSSMQVGKEFNASYKKIEKDWFFHNPTRANVGSLGIVPEVPEDAITSPEYQVWRLKGGFLPDFMALMLRTDYFLALVAFNRVGGVKQRMYYTNLAEIRLPKIPTEVQKNFSDRRQEILENITASNEKLAQRKKDIEKMILGTRPVEAH